LWKNTFEVIFPPFPASPGIASDLLIEKAIFTDYWFTRAIACEIGAPYAFAIEWQNRPVPAKEGRINY